MEMPDETRSNLRTEEKLMLEATGRTPSTATVRRLLEGKIDWDVFHDLLIKNGVYLPVAHTLMGHGKQIPPAVFKGFKLTYLVHEAHDRMMMSEARALARQFAKEGIDVVFLKGIHLKMAYYRPAHIRHLSDIDLLVRDDDVAAARKILGKIQYEYFDIEKRPMDYWLKFSQHLPYTHLKKKTMVDLHWNILPPNSPVEVPADELWSDVSPVGNVPSLKLLSAENLLIHLCLHMSLLGFYHVVPLRHLADIERVAHKGLDWDEVADKSRRWHCQAYIFPPLKLVNDCWKNTVPDAVLEKIAEESPKSLEPALRGHTLAETIRRAHHAYTLGDYMSEIYRTDGIGKKISLMRRPIFGRVHGGMDGLCSI
jgi:hypothetical protein